MGDDKLFDLVSKFIPNGLRYENFGYVARHWAPTICEVDKIGPDIILRVVHFSISGSHAKTIILMCKVGVVSLVLDSGVDSDIMMVGSTLDEVIIGLIAECARRTSLLMPNSVYDVNLAKVRNGVS